MNKLFRVITIICVFSLLILMPVKIALADGPAPVATPVWSPGVVTPVSSSAGGTVSSQAKTSGVNNQNFKVVSAPQGVPSSKGSAQTSGVIPLVTGGISVSSVWTADGNGNTKSTFNPGDAIRFYGNVSNTTGGSQTAYFAWLLNGPCGSYTLWSGNLSTGAGTYTWNLPTSVASNACGGNYTYSLQVTFNGSTSSKSMILAVNGGSVSVTSAWTADGNGNSKTVFVPGKDSIRYYGSITNSAGSSNTAHFKWSISSSACGAPITLWEGDLTTGTGTWSLGGTAPSCPSYNYTYTLSVTYNGKTTSQSKWFASGCQCVDYIKNRFNLSGNMVNAKDMGSILIANGFKKITAPQVGAVVVFQPGFGSSFSPNGHVAVITTAPTLIGSNWSGLQIESANQPQVGWMTKYNCTNVSDEPIGTYPKSSTYIAYYTR